jgi:putative DNA methylase
MTYRKKLIEVALPLEAINKGSKPETENPFLKGHPRSIHNWWARTPLSVCRAILFAQIVDDPSTSLPAEQASIEREKLLDIVRRLATWEAITDENLLNEAREIIKKSCGGKMPQFWDMFGGRASIPLEAQRLGLEVTSSDLNPVAVIIEKALLDIPARFADQPAVNQEARKELGHSGSWNGSEGLALDIRHYGKLLLVEGERIIGNLFPKVRLPVEQGGNEVNVNAYLWARRVKCANPACGAMMPLVSSFVLCSKAGKKAWIIPIVDKVNKAVRFEIRTGNGIPPEPPKIGRGAQFRCLVCEQPADEQHIKTEGLAGRIDVQLLAIVAEGNRSRIYIAPTAEQEEIAISAQPENVPTESLSDDPRNIWCVGYGLDTFDKLFTPRQLIALTTFSDLIGSIREFARRDALDAGLSGDETPLHEGGRGALAYADAIATFLAFSVSRLSDYLNSLCTWNPTNENIRNLFQRQAIPMVWDFAEANPIYGKLTIEATAEWVASALATLPASKLPARVLQIDGTRADVEFTSPPIISTDPPYYDNISYADLSDFFYIWLRRSLRKIYPLVFSTLLTPKRPELIASPYRFEGSNELAREHFRSGFEQTFSSLKSIAHPEFPMTIYYAFKQEEDDDMDGNERASTGWETMLDGLISTGFQVTGTLPVRTTKKARSVARGTNALASAVVLVARQRSADAPLATRREFNSTLHREIPAALHSMMQASIAPVDFAQAAIGPGMAVFSRYAKVLEADGTPMSVRTALQIINQALDAYLAAQDNEMDRDTRFCLAWFEQFSMNEGLFGDADVLARAKNTSVPGLVDAGVVHSRGGKVRLLKRDEYNGNWDPVDDSRVTVWECTQHLIQRLNNGGEEAAARLVNRLGGGRSEEARALSYRLFSLCERKKWADEALAYNALVVSWPAIQDKASQLSTMPSVQGELYS